MNWRRLLGIIREVRSAKTPSWALPTCPRCHISMADEGEGKFRCPKCGLVLDPAKRSEGPLLNEGDHRGPL